MAGGQDAGKHAQSNRATVGSSARGEAPQGGEARSALTEALAARPTASPPATCGRNTGRDRPWKVTWALSGKVTVAASPWTGCAHHAQGWTGDACRCPGCVALVLCLPSSYAPRASSTPSGYRILVPCSRLRTLPTQAASRCPARRHGRCDASGYARHATRRPWWCPLL